MARFRFRLQTLRRIREIHRDEQRGRLATAYEAERILQHQHDGLAAEAAQHLENQRRAMREGPIDVNWMLTTQRYQLALEAQIKVLTEQAAKLAEEVERRRVALVDADREVRVLDKLEERQRAQHRLAAMRAETKRLDEVAAVRWEGTE
ncbi:MAG: flagellar export protein FliJ [Planctomycetaceae bacterium]|nr:flagellar export protein FliJ [Planctomycetaceae bacterium]